VVAPLDTSELVGSESKLRRIHRSEAGRRSCSSALASRR
jgi:hypothetical protein